MAGKKKNTDRALFEEGGGRSKSKGDISPVFSTDGDVTWDDTSLGLGELFVGAYTAPEESEVPPKREPGTKIPGSYGWSATLNTKPDEETKKDGTNAGESKNVGDKKTVGLLEKLLGGPDPYGAKPSGFGKPQVPETEGDTTVPEKEPEEQIGTGVTDVEVNGYIEALRGILDPNYAARASEDVMGQYAAMTGGRPSSAAISAGTAARADAETALLRELLSGGDTQSGESGGLLSGLLGENATTGEMDVPEEYAGYADLPSYDTIVPMLESFESEEDMGDYLADMVNKGLISEAVATEYLKRFDDPYEEYDAGGRIDYASMVRNPGGWTLTDDGGTNFFGGLNRNMRIKSPNGQEFTVAQLYRLLKKNGMDAKEAETYLVKLQNYLKSKK